jgi:carboxyl-terminal processing protease
VFAADPSSEISWQEFQVASPIALLQRLVCPTIEFGGIGVEIANENGPIKVVTVMDGTPAAEAGIKANDIITHFNDETADGLTLNQAIEKMRGPANTKIKLKIKREGQESPIELSITRAIIKAHSKEVQK